MLSQIQLDKKKLELEYQNKIRFTTPYKINCGYKLIFENPRGLSICVLFAKSSA